jgi:hypothetical protein
LVVLSILAQHHNTFTGHFTVLSKYARYFLYSTPFADTPCAGALIWPLVMLLTTSLPIQFNSISQKRFRAVFLEQDHEKSPG